MLVACSFRLVACTTYLWIMYLTKTPFWLRSLYPSLVWRMPVQGEKKIYLTFDDGPHPQATPFVLDQLAEIGRAHV